jgi:P pilus assembly chaperone PapD
LHKTEENAYFEHYSLVKMNSSKVALFKDLFLLLLLLSLANSSNAQVGISVSPPRLYYELNPGQTGSNSISVSNVSTKHTLNLAITVGDWEYDSLGENVMLDAGNSSISSASWITVNQNYFSLKPGESKDIQITMSTPRDVKNTQPVHTALLFITQMNPTDDVNNAGANIKVNVRSAVKVYHRISLPKIQKVEIQNLLYNKEKKTIELYFQNQSNIWLDGGIFIDLLNNQTGKQIRLNPIAFYTLPGNKRQVSISVPNDLAKGKYTATVIIDHEDQNNLEAAELSFTYE